MGFHNYSAKVNGGPMLTIRAPTRAIGEHIAFRVRDGQEHTEEAG
jgi:hypothetical protein